MQHTFTLHEDLQADSWLRSGPDFKSGQVTGYRVGGCPTEARPGSQTSERPMGTTGGSCESVPTTLRLVGLATTRLSTMR